MIKQVSLILIATLLFSLAGCTQQPNNDKSSSELLSDSVTSSMSATNSGINGEESGSEHSIISEFTDSNHTSSSVSTFESSKPSSTSSSTKKSETTAVSIVADDTFLAGYDKKEDSLVMDIGAWYSPYQTDAAFKEFKDAGFTMVFLQGENAGRIDEYNKISVGLNLAAKYGLKAYLWADQRSTIAGSEFTKDYSKFPAFAGINYDEPTKDEINNRISPYVTKFNQMYPNDSMHINLYPLRAINMSGYGSYSEYISAAYSKIIAMTTGDKWLSVDDYPIMERNVMVGGATVRKKYINDMWLRNIEYIAEFAKDHASLKTHFFIQTMGYGDSNRQPTEADIRLQVYGLLAFGIDSYSNFCYYTPPVGTEFERSQYAIIKRDGTKSELYAASSKVNHEVLAFDHVYMQFNWKGVYCLDTGERNNAFNNLVGSLNLSSIKNIKNLTSNQDVLVGCFEDTNSRPGFIVLNYNETSLDLTSKLKMEFKDATRVAVYKGGERKVYNISSNTYEIVLASGQGAFVVPF